MQVSDGSETRGLPNEVTKMVRFSESIESKVAQQTSDKMYVRSDELHRREIQDNSNLLVRAIGGTEQPLVGVKDTESGEEWELMAL